MGRGGGGMSVRFGVCLIIGITQLALTRLLREFDKFVELTKQTLSKLVKPTNKSHTVRLYK